MLHPIKITSTLADETRFSVYEYMLQQKNIFQFKRLLSDLTSTRMSLACI